MLMYVTMLKKQPPLNRAFPFSNKKKAHWKADKDVFYVLTSENSQTDRIALTCKIYNGQYPQKYVKIIQSGSPSPPFVWAWP